MGFFSSLFGRKDNSQLLAAIEEGGFLVDVRTPAEFSGGSVKGAVNIPLNMLPNQRSKFKGKQHIIVFCRSGMRSSQAKSILEKNGFLQVIDGGSWKNVSQLVKPKRKK